MHIFTAQYYHRLWGLLLFAFPIISAWLLIAAAHTNDQEAADKQAWSLLPAGASVLHAHSLYPRRRTAPFPYVCLSAQVASDRAKRTLLTGSSDQACLSAASLSLVWAAAMRSHAEIIGKTDCNNRHFASDGLAYYEHCFAGEGKELTSSSLDFMSSMTEALISEVFKTPVLWDHRTKD
jgi:hypothetical protein